MTYSMRLLLMLTPLVLALGCWRDTPVKEPIQPLVPVRAPCLRSKVSRPSLEWIQTVSLHPVNEAEMLWARIEVLEDWARKAWLGCGKP